MLHPQLAKKERKKNKTIFYAKYNLTKLFIFFPLQKKTPFFLLCLLGLHIIKTTSMFKPFDLSIKNDEFVSFKYKSSLPRVKGVVQLNIRL